MKLHGRRQKRNGLRTSILNAGQVALPYLRFIFAGEATNASAKFGRLGAMLANSAHTVELTASNNMEAAYRSAKVRNAIWSHLTRGRGNVATTLDELTNLDRERLPRRQ